MYVMTRTNTYRFKKICMLPSGVGHLFVKDVGLVYVVGEDTIVPANLKTDEDKLSRLKAIYIGDVGNLKCHIYCSSSTFEKYLSLLSTYHGPNVHGIYLTLGMFHLGMNRELLGRQYNVPPVHIMGPGHSGN